MVLFTGMLASPAFAIGLASLSLPRAFSLVGKHAQDAPHDKAPVGGVGQATASRDVVLRDGPCLVLNSRADTIFEIAPMSLENLP